MYPNLHTPAYFQLHGNPSLILDQTFLPQTLRNNRWEVEYDLPSYLHNVERIDEATFKEMTKDAPPYRK